MTKLRMVLFILLIIFSTVPMVWAGIQPLKIEAQWMDKNISGRCGNVSIQIINFSNFVQELYISKQSPEASFIMDSDLFSVGYRGPRSEAISFSLPAKRLKFSKIILKPSENIHLLIFVTKNSDASNAKSLRVGFIHRTYFGERDTSKAVVWSNPVPGF